jgi:hypothetical protein
MRKIYIYALGIVLLFSDWGSVWGEKVKTESEVINFSTYISKTKLPDRLDFCGELVPLDNPIVRERAEREFYYNLQNPGQIVLYLKRAGRMFPLFDSIFAMYGIPEDFKYLAVAESGLQIAKSPKEAYGIWQFIPSTAKEYGLLVDDFIDERLNLRKSTEAASKYLKRAYQTYKSWSLAAAAYNMGFTNLTDNINFQGVTNFFDLFLNEETSRYIFRIVILKELMQNHKKYGFVLEQSDFYKPFPTKKIICKSKIPDLALWAKEQGTTYFWVKFLNPWILKRSLPEPKEPYVIEILER